MGVNENRSLNKFSGKLYSTLLVVVDVIYKALCFDVAQGRMNGRPMRLELIRVGLLV